MDDTLLTQKEFDDLLEYSTSIPTGTTIGKRWKRRIIVFKTINDKIFNAGYLPPNTTFIEEYYLIGEYIPSEKEGQIGIQWKKSVVVGNLEIDKQIYQFKNRNLS